MRCQPVSIPIPQEEGDMRKAIIEVLGAVFANAPLSDDTRGRRSRRLAFAIVVLLFVVVIVAMEWR